MRLLYKRAEFLYTDLVEMQFVLRKRRHTIGLFRACLFSVKEEKKMKPSEETVKLFEKDKMQPESRRTAQECHGSGHGRSLLYTG